jgi:superfamily II DNA helicase RecQ
LLFSRLIKARSDVIKQAIEFHNNGSSSTAPTQAASSSSIASQGSTDIPAITDEDYSFPDIQEVTAPTTHDGFHQDHSQRGFQENFGNDDLEDDIEVIEGPSGSADCAGLNSSGLAGTKQHGFARNSPPAWQSPPPPPPPPPPPQGEVFEVPEDDEENYWDMTEDIDLHPAHPPATANVKDAQVSDAVYQPPTDPTSAALQRSPLYPEVQEILRNIFDLQGFRRHQLEAIIATLQGRDVVVLMPTGGGKSLCYQLPALCEGGTTRGMTVVISPLIALMLDQVQALRRKDIKVNFYSREQSVDEQRFVTQAVRGPVAQKPKLLYLTPERLALGGTLSMLLELQRLKQLARFVIDEAHLIHTWGRDFRCSFNQLSVLREKFPTIPIIALTATAPPVIVHDIIATLRMDRNVLRLEQSYNRPNLHYFVHPKSRSPLPQITEYIKTKWPDSTGIVYCGARQKCEDVAAALRKANIKAMHFHAELQPMDKKEILEGWMNDQYKVIVATIAFGMGIDKADGNTCFTIQLANKQLMYSSSALRDSPRHSYFSDWVHPRDRSCWSGRQGLRVCSLYVYGPSMTFPGLIFPTDSGYSDSQYHLRRIREQENMTQMERQRQEDDVRDMIDFANNDTDCRRAQLLDRFRERFDPAQCNATCDNCLALANGSAEAIEHDMTDAARNLVLLMQSAELRERDFKVGRGALLSAFHGSHAKDVLERGLNLLPQYGIGKGFDKKLTARVFDRFIVLDVFKTFIWTASSGHPITSHKVRNAFLCLPPHRHPSDNKLQLGPRAEAWLSSGQRMILKARPTKEKAPAKQKEAIKVAAPSARKRKTARTELEDDPIEEDAVPAPSARLWQDDDDDDAQIPAPTASAGPSRTRAAQPTRSRQAGPSNKSLGEDLNSECFRKLQDVRKQVSMPVSWNSRDCLKQASCSSRKA